ncbi:hypothetical protein ACOMHN_037473 [Nucella lapillus]
MKSSNGFEQLEMRQSDASSFGSGAPTIVFGQRSSSRRKMYLLAGGVVLLLVVALAVGLALGLRREDDSSEKGDNNAIVDSSTTTPTPSTTSATTADPRGPVVVVSLDGFRASYLSYNVTPVLHRLIGEGAHSPRLLPAYPSLTFPNHLTIATGLYPESHGIVDNKMFDINMKRFYKLGTAEAGNAQWYSGEPIWLTAQRQGQKSACFFWVGSDVPIQGEYPHEYRKYNASVPYAERVDTVLDWLSRPKETRPDLVMLYFSEPDHTGHARGPGPTSEERYI